MLSAIVLVILSLSLASCSSITSAPDKVGDRVISSTPSCFVRVIKTNNKKTHINLIKRTAMSYQEEIIMKDEFSEENVNSFLEICKKLQADNECVCNNVEK